MRCAETHFLLYGEDAVDTMVAIQIYGDFPMKPNFKVALPAALCALAFATSANAFSLVDSLLPKVQMSVKAFTIPATDSTYCHATDERDVGKCQEGELMLFTPNSYGDKQLPLIVIASFCDYGAPIFFNEAGLVCRKVPLRQQYSPSQETARTQWQELKNKVESSGSGYAKWDDGTYYRVIKEGTEKTPDFPYRATVRAQITDALGNPVGEPEIFEEIVHEANKDMPAAQPVGTTFDTILFHANLTDSYRALITVEKVEPLIPKAEKTVKKPKK